MKTRFFLAFLTLLLTINGFSQNWYTSFEDAQKAALASNKLILVDFWATWCGPCKQMDIESWNTPEVQNIMSHFVPLKIDIDNHTDLALKYNINSIPNIFIMDPNGEVIHSEVSYKNKSQLLKYLKTYDINTTFINNYLIQFYKKPNFPNTYRLASRYQDFVMYVNNAVKYNYIKISKQYLKKAKKQLSKETQLNQLGFKQRFTLLEIKEKLLYNKPKKAKKLLKKINYIDLDKMNKDLYNLLNYLTCECLHEIDKATEWKTKLSENSKKKASLFMKKMQI